MKEMNKLNEQELENVAGGTLSQDEALAKALEHANLSRSQVDFVKKVQMDYEHGRKVYEIEFNQGRYEYEYDVDAESGQILKFERGYDD